MPKVSIIVPTFNRPSSLKKTLESIQQQTFNDYEVLIISNGGVDNSKEIVESFNDSRFFYFYQEGTGSPASPRNNGIRRSKGSFLAFCDDDDLWLPNKLKLQIDFLEDNPEYAACCTYIKRFNDDSEWINQDEKSKNPITTLNLLYKNTVPLSSLFLRKKIFEKIEPFNEDKNIFGSEDYELVLRLSIVSKIFCIEKYLVLYNSGNFRLSNVTSQSSLKRYWSFIIRIFYVYKILITKGFLRWDSVIFPLCRNIFNCIKYIAYDTIKYLSRKF